jgi:prolyl-tRNA editing enzyme YbaK/EbsC (Cys-tRNA(Pro) deacylase)
VSKAIDRFTEAARVHGLHPEVRRFPQGTKTASDAAEAIGCEVGQIVKSLVFMVGETPVLALTSGANRVDTAALGALAGAGDVRRASPEEARAATGFAVGGTPPLASHLVTMLVFVDGALMEHDEVWAGAGDPDAVFSLTPEELVRVSGGTVASFAE